MLDTPSPADRQEIVDLIARAGNFVQADVECVDELLDEYFDKPDHGGYQFLVQRDEGQITAMACYGATPLTEGTFDLYWLCVAPESQGRGIGRTLLREVEADLRRQGARMLVIETSGTPAYLPARSFYLANGCHRQATIPDFYARGDDLVFYTKRYDD